MDRSLSVIIKNSSFLREKSDYDDFFIAGKKEAEKQIEDAEQERQKNEKLYKTLGMTIGLAIVILLA